MVHQMYGNLELLSYRCLFCVHVSSLFDTCQNTLLELFSGQHSKVLTLRLGVQILTSTEMHVG